MGKDYDNTEKIYTFILDVDDEYEGKVDGNYKIGQYFALADEAREYMTNFIDKSVSKVTKLDGKFIILKILCGTSCNLWCHVRS